MGFCCKLMSLIFLFLTGYSAYCIWRAFTYIPPLPEISTNTYWGPGKTPAKLSTKVMPFTVEFKPSMIEDLKSRLRNSRYVESLEGTASTYGFRHSELKKIVDFWAEKYDFAEREKYLNKYPHFKTNIQGLDMHFIHIKPKSLPKGTKVLPLLLVHGWPGSVIEFYKIIPFLTTPRKNTDFVFELVIPSLPGFGWSQAASKPGLGTTEIAVVMANLMKRLGYDKYYIQGGDWGAVVTNAMALYFPDHVMGYHTNFPMSRRTISLVRNIIGEFFPSWFVEEKFAHRVLPMSNILYNVIYESGYFHIHATKPDTLGAAIGDSPSGLAAWILEKVSIATNAEYRNRDDGGITEKFTLEEWIDNLMVYWSTNTAATSIRIYAESLNVKYLKEKVDQIPVIVPTAASRFPHEINYFTDEQLRDKYVNLLQTTDMPRGGHFAALEEPELLADDIFSAVKLFIQFHANKSHKDREDL